MAGESADSGPLVAALGEFVNARDDRAVRAIVEEHWSILNVDDADEYIGDALERYAAQEDMVARLRNRRELLYRCRTEGIHSAFASEPKFESGLLEILDKFLTADLGAALRQHFIDHREVLLSGETERVLAYWERYYRDEPKLLRRVRDRRNLLRVAMDQGLDAALPVFSNEQAILDALQLVMMAPDWPSKVAAAKSHETILLTKEADRFLGHLLSKDPPPAIARELTLIRGMLTRARLHGFEATGVKRGPADPSHAEPLDEVQIAQMAELQSLIAERFGEGTLIREIDIEQLLEERSDLRAAWQNMRRHTMFLDSDHPDRIALQKILEQIPSLDPEHERRRIIGLLRQAADIPLVQQSPELWGSLQLDLAKSLASCPGDRAVLLEEALTRAQSAERTLRNHKDRRLWAESSWSIGGVLTDRMVGSRADNIEQALRCFEAAHEILQAGDTPPQRIRRWLDLAKAHMTRVLGSPRENIETTLSLLRNALDDADFSMLSAIERGDLLLTFGNGMMVRVAGEAADNIEAAFHAFHEAQRLFVEADSQDRLGLASYALGNALLERSYGDATQNRDEALRHIETCLSLSAKDVWPDRWARAQLSRAAILAGRAGPPDETELALQCLRDAQTVLTRSGNPHEWAMAESNLAQIFLAKAHATEHPGDIEAAIRHLYAALEVFGRDGDRLRWSDLHFKLGWTHGIRAKRGAQDAAVRAEEHFRLSLEGCAIDTVPNKYAQAQIGLTALLLQQGRWQDAHSALTEVIRAGLMEFDAAYTEVGRHEAMEYLSAAFAQDAYVLLRLERYEDALLRLDAGKIRILAQALALANMDSANLQAEEHADLQQLRRSVQELESRMRDHDVSFRQPTDRSVATALREARSQLSDLLRRIRTTRPDLTSEGLTLLELLALIPAGGALVAPVITSSGGAVFVIPHGCTRVTQQNVIHLESFDRETLVEILQGPQQLPASWFKAYLGDLDDPAEWQTWLDTIDRVGQRLWSGLMGKVHELLVATGLREGAPVILMPQAGLALLPMHSAWREVNGQRRYIIDDFTVSHVPNGYALSVSRRRLQHLDAQAHSLLAIINPTDDLTYAGAEGDALEILFGAACTALRERAATLAAVAERISQCSHIHFCCHGFYDRQNPMRSGLLLARGDMLELSHVLGTIDLNATRLVTLSACETGITDVRRMPDEYIGLSAGFLQAGAAAVISTLWPVGDLSTMLLMRRFYQRHITMSEPPAAALRNAQRWLRDATHQELAEYLAPFESAADGLVRSHHLAWQRFSDLARTHPAAQPFRHPFHWAAFVLNGA